MAGSTQKIRWSYEDIEFLKNNYLTMSSNEIAKKLNRTYQSIQGRLKRLYKNCTSKRTVKTQIKHSTNEDRFLADSNEFYYLMGLIASDGNIHGTKNLITIKLQEKDIKLLEKIRDYFEITHPIRSVISNGFKAGSKAKVLAFSSKLLKTRLASFGIHPAKSKTICITRDIPNDFLGSFIRGVFDGDGCVCKTRDNAFVVNICSMSKTFLEYLHNKIGYGKISTNAKGMSFLNIRSYERRSFYDLIYQNDGICLDRKHLLMKESLQYGNARETF